MDDLISRARRWADEDPDPTTGEEIRRLLDAPDVATTDLADRFAAWLEFGTAGLRGVLGAGPNRMNTAVVLRTTWGLAKHLSDTNAKGPVVVGFDGRRMSREFAEATACVLAAQGIQVFLFDAVIPTPGLAFAVSHLKCAAGVMITASHNPPEYNGYKAYWANGAQIIPPTDVAIAKAIESAPPAKDVPCVSLPSAMVRMVGEDVKKAYLAEVKKLAVRKDGDRSLTIVYTPLHGVGNELARRAFADAGFTNVFTVPEQEKPDGAFPTVEFPNPEEKGAMDLSFALARAKQADLVLANDPDADRLAVALPDGEVFVQLTGNQVGVLLGHYILTAGLTKEKADADALVIASIVSSPMLSLVARELGAQYAEVLTGFKWIANRALELRAARGSRFAYGYEEALGYTVGELVRDKDGISAAVIFAELAAVLKAQGTTVLAHLESLYRQYGLFASSQVNVTKKGVDGLRELRAIMSRLRDAPPKEIAGEEVVMTKDCLRQIVIGKNGEQEPTGLPPSDVLVFELANGARVIARPSGTEPKAKFYFDVREPVAAGEPIAAAETRAAARMKKLADAFVALAK